MAKAGSSAKEKTMAGKNFLRRLSVAWLIAASLFLTTFAVAEELAPGFDACMKQAKAAGTNGSGNSGYERSEAAVNCYEAAEKYWKTIFETEYRRIIPDDDKYNADKATSLESCMVEFRSEWSSYLDAGCTLVSNGDKARQNPVSARFRAEETKTMVTRFQDYGVFRKEGTMSQNMSPAPREEKEELAPGFDACMKQAKAKAGKNGDDSGYEKTRPALQCYEAAYSYWDDILLSEYKRKVPDEQACMDLIFSGKPVKDEGVFLYMFYANWQRYQQAVCNLVAGDGGGYGKDPVYMRYTTQETKRVVRMLQQYGIFRKTGAGTQAE